jgi:hypothetical protein
MTTGLSVSRLIALSLSLTNSGAQYANLNSIMLLGQSDVIDTATRIQSFTSLSAVASAFGTSAPEYLAAQAFFSQSPQPLQLYIGRWAQAAVHGYLFGGPLTVAQQAIANFTAITAGGFHIQVDAASSPVEVGPINLSAVTNLNGVATDINTALTTASVGATCAWSGSQFVFKSSTTGATSKVLPLTVAATGMDMSAILGGTLATNAREVDGIAAESALTAVTLIDGLSPYWYGLCDDACPNITDADHEAIAGYIEAAPNAHVYGFTSGEAAALSSAYTSDVGYILNALGYRRTFISWSETSPYSAASYWGRLVTTNFLGSNTTISLAYKTLPGIVADTLTDGQASALDAKGYNYNAIYNNGVAVITNGWSVCSSPLANQVFIDEIYGADALSNTIQTNYFNLLVTLNKLPQTDSGSHLGANAIEAGLKTFVRNGYLAAGTWTSGGFGQLALGDFLPKGYYLFTPPAASQAQNNRTARQSVPYQIAAKTAGAIQSANIALTINP